MVIGHSTDGKFFCLDGKCKNSKYKHKGVTRETLKNHAKKAHLKDINFQTKTADVIGEAWKCNLCNKVLSRNQTFVSHQRRYHPDISSSASSDSDQITNRNSNHHQERTAINEHLIMNHLTTMTSNNDVLQINNGGTSPTITFQTLSPHQVIASDNQLSEFDTNNEFFINNSNPLNSPYVHVNTVNLADIDFSYLLN